MLADYGTISGASMKKLLPMIVLAGCAATAETQAPQPRAGFPVYQGRAAINPATRQLDATWRIAFVPDSATADSVRLLLNRGLQISSVRANALASFTSKDTAGYNNVTLRWKPAVAPGHPVSFDIAYAGIPHFSEDSINGIGTSWIELGLDGFWHPVFSGYNQYITGSLELTSPVGWQVVASGSVERQGDGIVVQNDVPLIDIALVAAPAIREQTIGATTVYHTSADAATVQRVLNTTAACAAYLNQRYAERESLPHAKIVLAPRKGPGYARKNYIVISDVSALPGEALDRYICHELAHFWSSNAVSSGPENWLNEAFAEFVSARFVRAARGDAAYQKIVQQWADAGKDQPPVWTPSATRRPGARVAYRKAPHILHQLEEQIGTPVMDRILAHYMTNRIATTPALLDAVAQIAGQPAAVWLTTQLATGN
jgi:hypothetical protein